MASHYRIISLTFAALFLCIYGTPAYASLFEGKLYSSDISPFYKWTDVIERMDAEQDFQKHLSEIWAGPPIPAAINQVNNAVNRFHFVEDNVLWGQSDYWQTPEEFFSIGGGDCEDFAIAKYAWLKALGLREEDMRIAIVYDRFLHTMHTLLLVETQGHSFVLDNQEKATEGYIMEARYRPVFSFNRNAWWIY